jgi:predicted regulator of Ras-like GTPase activity (Roadblock/LC7/MglB family)
MIDKDIQNSLNELLGNNKVIAITISSYEGLLIYRKGIETVDKKQLSVEIAKIAKSVQTNLPTQIKSGIILCIYYDKYELLIGFFKNFIISFLCETKVNMGFLKIKIRELVPKILASL